MGEGGGGGGSSFFSLLFIIQTCFSRPLGRVSARGADHKIFKMIQINVVMVGLTISMHFQQFEDLKFQFFSWGPRLFGPS